MASRVIALITVLIGVVSSQSTPSNEPWVDPLANGKPSNPGGRIHLCKKSLDAVHQYAAESMARTLQSITIGELVLNYGVNGTVIIKPPRFQEVSLGNHEYELISPNRIASRFHDGHLTATGVWLYKPYSGPVVGDTIKATMSEIELITTSEFGRTFDGKPTIKTIDCKTNLGISDPTRRRLGEGQFNAPKRVENCDSDPCIKMLQHWGKAYCEVLSSFVKLMVNADLQQYETRVTMPSGPQKVDYSLTVNSPVVFKDKMCIRADLEAKYSYSMFGSPSFSFHPNEMQWFERDRLVSFLLSDYTFNTMLHQAHTNGHKHSASDLIAVSPSMEQLLSVSCGIPASTESPTSTSTTTTAKPAVRKLSRTGSRSGNRSPSDVAAPGGTRGLEGQKSNHCLGSYLDSFDPQSSNDTGDIVYKSGQKAPSVYIESETRGYFDGGIGSLEIYSAKPKFAARQLALRVDVRMIRGEFTPKLNKHNITGSVKITALKLAQPSPQTRMLDGDWLERFTQFVTPILTETFNYYFDRFAQFPLPIPDNYVCSSPDFSVQPRTVQLDCDVERNGTCTGYQCCASDGCWCC